MKVDFVEFSVCRILALEAKEVSKACNGGNGLWCLAGTILLQSGSSQLLAKLHSLNGGGICLSGEGTV